MQTASRLRNAILVGAWVVLVFLPTSARAQPDPRAQELNQQGKDHFAASRFEEALSAFEQAYGYDPAPTFLYNMARCLERLGRSGEAVEMFRRYLREDPQSPKKDAVLGTIRYLEERAADTMTRFTFDTRPEGAAVFLNDDPKPLGETPLAHWLPYGTYRVRLRLAGYVEQDTTVDVTRDGPARLERSLLPLPGRLLLQGVPDGARIEVDGAVVATTPLAGPLDVAPGRRVVRVLQPGMTPWQQEVTVASGGATELAVTLSPATALDGGPTTVVSDEKTERGFEYPWYAWTTTGVTAAGLGAGIAFLVLAQQKGDEAQRYARGGPEEDFDRWQSAKDEASQDLVIGSVALGVAGAAAVGTGLALWLHNRDTGDDGDEGPSVTVLPLPDATGVSLELQF